MISWSELLAEGKRRLEIAGIDDAVNEARYLIFKVLDVDPVTLITSPDQPVAPKSVDLYRAALERREKREPAQHIIGHDTFFGLHFKVDSRALIPRSDSEEVVCLAHDLLTQKPGEIIADLGAGSGILLGSLLHAHPAAQGIAVERDPDAFELARENLTALGFLSRLTLFKGSWTDWNGWATTDLIISNPPYIASDVIPTLAPEVRDHDPMDALDGGADGLDAYREIITLARGMKPGAHLVLEIGYDQKTAVTALLEAARFTHITHRKDLGGNDRAIAATAP